MAQKMQAYYSIPKYHWNPNPNVDYKSNVIIFLPNTNFNNIRAMSLISVFFFKDRTRAIRNNGWLIWTWSFLRSNVILKCLANFFFFC